MAHLDFYEKPGCAGNARQRALLEASGHTLTRHSILETPWTRAELLSFLQGLPVAQWFNRAAPRVKSGAVVPESLDAEAALALLLADPLLIRRPLMRRPDGVTLVGFETSAVERFVGLEAGLEAALNAGRPLPATLEGCAAHAPAHHLGAPGGCSVPAAPVR